MHGQAIDVSSFETIRDFARQQAGVMPAEIGVCGSIEPGGALAEHFDILEQRLARVRSLGGPFGLVEAGPALTEPDALDSLAPRCVIPITRVRKRPECIPVRHA